MADADGAVPAGGGDAVAAETRSPQPASGDFAETFANCHLELQANFQLLLVSVSFHGPAKTLRRLSQIPQTRAENGVETALEMSDIGGGGGGGGEGAGDGGLWAWWRWRGRRWRWGRRGGVVAVAVVREEGGGGG